MDGTAVELSPAGTLVLEVGDHVFEFHAEGRLPIKRTVRVKGGETETVRVRLRPVMDEAAVAQSAEVSAQPAASSNSMQPRVDTPLRKKWWVWTAAGVAVVAAVTTIAIMLSRDTGTDERPFTTTNTLELPRFGGQI